MYEINGICYVLNLTKINAYLFQSQSDKFSEIEITENFTGEANLLEHKQYKEIKANGNLNLDAMKYDFFKEMFSLLTSIDSENMDLSYAEKLAVNTFINEGFLIQAIDN